MPAPCTFLQRSLALAAFAVLLLPARVVAQAPLRRPRIMAVAHIALRSADLNASRRYYAGHLGLGPDWVVRNAAGQPVADWYPVNPHQYVELVPGLATPDTDRLIDIAFETSDVRALRNYLTSRGVRVPDAVATDATGNLSFTVTDPDGHSVQFVQYLPHTALLRHLGDRPRPGAISHHILHVGIIVHDRAAADRFYRDILGFHEFWQGGVTAARLDYVDMRVPDGPDWVEYMLSYGSVTTQHRLSAHHLALEVSDVHASAAELQHRGLRPETPHRGRNGRWQVNFFDPDGTRSELMEPHWTRKPCCEQEHDLYEGSAIRY